MKKPPIPPAQAGHQTVPEFISMPTLGAAIPSGFTYQNVSGHAGLVPFWGCLHWQRFHALLAGVRPHVRTSPKAIPPATWRWALSPSAAVHGDLSQRPLQSAD